MSLEDWKIGKLSHPLISHGREFQKLVAWFHYDVYCTHQISLLFFRWCLLYTSHHLVILTMMLFVHITSAYDSKNDVMCTQHISYDSKDDVMCTRRTRVMIWVDFYSLHDIMVMVQETISCVHVTSGLWFHWWFHVNQYLSSNEAFHYWKLKVQIN